MSLLNSKQVPLEFQVEQKKFKKYHKIKYKTGKLSVSRQRGGFAFVVNQHLYIYPKRMLAVLKLLKPAMKDIKSFKQLEKKKKKCLLSFEPNMDSILTKKPKDIRMGRGKGVPSEKVNAYQSGFPLFTLYNLSTSQSRKLFLACSRKFSSKNNIISIAEW